MQKTFLLFIVAIIIYLLPFGAYECGRYNERRNQRAITDREYSERCVGYIREQQEITERFELGINRTREAVDRIERSADTINDSLGLIQFESDEIERRAQSALGKLSELEQLKEESRNR